MIPACQRLMPGELAEDIDVDPGKDPGKDSRIDACQHRAIAANIASIAARYAMLWLTRCRLLSRDPLIEVRGAPEDDFEAGLQRGNQKK